MNVLFASAEAYPFIKIGGLGDVAYALPKALNKIGCSTCVILPLYESIINKYKNEMIKISDFSINLSWRNQYCGLYKLNYDGIDYYFLDNEYYFKRKNPYGYYDDGERFSFFSRAVLEAVKYLDNFVPNIIHLNDWHCAMAAPLFKHFYKDDNLYKNMKIVYTIHNLKFQGIFGHEILEDLLNLPDYYYDENMLKFYDGVSFMKGGIMYSDFITTVSRTYANEIKTPFYGEGLQGLLNSKSYKLRGIVNGIDFDIFNPKCDKSINYNYSIEDFENKYKNKEALQKEFNFEVNRNIPIYSMITRLTDQKGIDITLQSLEQILYESNEKIQFVILGSGSFEYENALRYLSYKYPDKFYSYIGYNEALAQKIYAGSDFFLMPSLYEPCGIGQLIALRYGTIPIVREVGGLYDTVNPYNEFTGEGNGFTFKNYDASELLGTIMRSKNIYKDKNIMDNLMRKAMEKDNSWSSSAREYLKLYEEISNPF